MPEHPSNVPGDDAELTRALARLELGDLPDALHAAVATALTWASGLDREVAQQGATRPR